MSEQKLSELLKWPTDEAGVTVDIVLRCVGVDTQRTWLRNQVELGAQSRDGEYFKSALYADRTHAIISAVGFMACLRILRDVDPKEADTFAREYWRMCDAGDSFGELLWEFTEAAGLDPALIKLAE